MNRDEMDGRQAWDQLPTGKEKRGETAVAYATFRVYFQLPPGQRSLRRAAKIVGKSLTLVERWSAAYDWIKRAAARDRHFAAIEDEQHEEVARANAAKWATREQQQREQDYEDGQAMRRKGRQITDFPLTKKVIESDGQTVHIHPIGWSAALGPTYLVKGSELSRSAIERHGPVHDEHPEKINFEGIPIEPDDEGER